MSLFPLCGGGVLPDAVLDTVAASSGNLTIPSAVCPASVRPFMPSVHTQTDSPWDITRRCQQYVVARGTRTVTDGVYFYVFVRHKVGDHADPHRTDGLLMASVAVLPSFQR